jgi:hypothetical protein
MMIRIRVRVALHARFSGRAVGIQAGKHDAEMAVDPAAQFASDDLLARVRAIQAEVAQLRVFDSRSPDAIIGYNERGHFD